MPTELEIKTERLMQVIRMHGLGGVLLNGQHNFAWITGGTDNGVDRSRDNGVASVLVTSSGKRFLLANRIEMPRLLDEQVSANDFEPVDFGWQEEKSSSRFVIGIAIDLAGSAQIATDIPLDSSSPAIDGSIAHERCSLTVEEVERFRLLGRDAGIAVKDTVTKVQSGQSELEIAAAMSSELEKHSIRSVVSLVAADERIAKYRHPVPTANRLKNTVMLVACARRGGLTASLTRIATIGKASDDLIERTKAAAFVNANLWHATREGVSGRELYEVAAKAYAEVGFAGEIDKHHQGGAAGYRTREWVAHPECLDQVQSNQAFAWNPSITGTKVEETVIAANGTCEVITASPGWPTITHTIDGIDYHSPGILEI